MPKKPIKNGETHDGVLGLAHTRDKASATLITLGLCTICPEVNFNFSPVFRCTHIDHMVSRLRYDCDGSTVNSLMVNIPFAPFSCLPGTKIWGVACQTGYCFVGYSDGSYKEDPNLRQWADCPLG